MSNYLSYEDYLELGGDLDESVFNRYAFRAENAIDFRTFDRIHKLDLAEQSERFLYALHMTMYDLISLYVANDSYVGLAKATTVDADGNTVPEVRLLGQSNDGVTVTYNVAGARDALFNIDKQMNDVMEKNLSGITFGLNGSRKLLWRGIYPDE